MNKNSELTAFNKLFSDYKERFVRFAYTYVRDQAVAEDFVIDSLIYYWKTVTDWTKTRMYRLMY